MSKCWLYNPYAIIITAIAERFLCKLSFLRHTCYYYAALQFKGVVYQNCYYFTTVSIVVHCLNYLQLPTTYSCNINTLLEK